jgi:hypothetical protein
MLWIIYFFFLVLFILIGWIGGILSIFNLLLENHHLSLNDYFSIILLSFAVYGLYCFIFNIKSFSKVFWKYFLWFFVLSDLISSYYDGAIVKQKFSVVIVELVMDAIVLWPLFYALYKLSKGAYRKKKPNKVGTKVASKK